MKRFTYSSGGQQSSSKGKGALSLHGGTSRKPSSFDSPRKRKRSPGEGESGTPLGTTGSSSKILKKSDSFCEEDDDLDELGTAALEEFELTQNHPSTTPSPVPKPIPNPQALNPSESHSGLSTTTRQWHNPYKKGEESSSHTCTSALPQHKTPSSVSPGEDYTEKIRQLQEQNYSKDGEVKVLRSEKDRLLEELRKKEERMYEIQTQLLSEKQAIEQQLLKENQSLSTKLNFAEQEVFKLRENYSFLEQMQKSSSQISPNQREPPKPVTPLKTSRAKVQQQSSRQSKDPSTQFLSTETFMPLSQVSSRDVTPVQVGNKRPAPDEEQSIKQLRRPSVSSVSRGTSSKGTSSPKKASALSSVKKSNEKLLATPNVQDENSPSKKPTSFSDHPNDAVVLDVPSTELTGTQLLMLLVHRNLLKIPDFKSLESSSADHSQSSLDEQSTSDDATPNSSNSEPAYQRKLTGLLSLLHIERKDLYSPADIIFSSVSDLAELYSNSPSVAVSSKPTSAPDMNSTPVRKPRLQLQKPYTSGRLELARSRTRQSTSAGVAQAKSYSASNTPVHAVIQESSEMTGSLFSSVNKGQLEKSIASLLLSADSSHQLSVGASYSQNRRFPLSPSPFSASKSESSIFILLKQAHDIITKYHSDQLAKIQQNLNTSGLASEFVEDVSNMPASPKSIFSGSNSNYSKTSSELFSPPKADQELVSQALEILETLVTYSKDVRQQILEQPPHFTIDSRPSSSMDVYPAVDSVANTSSSAEDTSIVASREKFQKETDRATTAVKLQKKLLFLAEQDQPVTPVQGGLTSEETLQWKDGELVQLRGSDGVPISDKIWIQKQLSVRLDSDSRVNQQATPSSHPTSRGFGQLLSILLELPAPRWRESLENVLSCIRILSALAADCPLDVLERFSSLLSEESIGICFDKEDSQLTLAVLSLLTHMMRSPTLAAMLCTLREPSCIPYTCYQCLLEPPAAESSDTVFKIRIQILRLLSNILVTRDGPVILLEACNCAHEILKSLVSLLVKLVDTVYKPSQWSHQERVLLREVLTLMHKISVHDRYFDTHCEECEDGYIFSLHKLSWLLKTAPFHHEVSLVQELLYYCEDLDDSQEHSEGGGDAMDTV